MAEPRFRQYIYGYWDSCDFDYDPETISPIPEARKTVDTIRTYGGSDVFEWPAIIAGQEVTLTWSLMPNAMYQSLQNLYFSGDECTWGTRNQRTYQVVIMDLTAKFVDAVFYRNRWRLDVELKLFIRSEAIVANP